MCVKMIFNYFFTFSISCVYLAFFCFKLVESIVYIPSLGGDIL